MAKASIAIERPTVHVTMGPELMKKLKRMAEADRRPSTEFVRLLIEDEWDRRQKGNGQ